MASEKKFKKDKEILLECDNHMKDIRQQLAEQLKCLDVRLDSHVSLLFELQDFYKRRAEVELEYSQKLDKLVKNIMVRHKTEKQKRELWPGYSTYKCWQTLLAGTRRQSQDHQVLGEIYSGHMNSRFSDIVDDTQRITKRCRDVGTEVHEKLINVLGELQSSMKTYHLYHGESRSAEGKLRDVEQQKQKAEQKSTLRRDLRSVEKKREKRQLKYTENKLKALKARNEYLLCLDVANAAMHKYYVEDLPDLIDCMDFGYHNTLARILLIHVSAEDCCLAARRDCKDLLNKCVTDLDQAADKQHFLELNHHTYSLPRKFEFQSHKGDEVCQISAQKPVQEEMVDRLHAVNSRIRELRLENDEIWKTLETAEKSLLDLLNEKDYDQSALFTHDDGRLPKSPHEYVKKRSDRLETEAFYLNKFHSYLMVNNLIGRLQSRFNSLQMALGEGHAYISTRGDLVLPKRPPSLPPKPGKKRRIGRSPTHTAPRLFGGSISEYVEATGQEIPLVVKSCVRVINLYGMHHQGVFRVSGSQNEINEFKNLFEKGDDPLLDVTDGKDVNSIAGVLKLYFRELKDPLFPIPLFDAFISAARLESQHECVCRLKELLSTLRKPVLVVMRYMFAFLNHLSEYSDENMMDPYNLAICFGPTLLPIPTEHDHMQVTYQTNVNDLIKIMLVHQEELFPRDGGPYYEKCIVEADGDAVDSLDNLSDDEEDARDAGSEEEPDELEAVAQYDFTGRTGREITFRKGDVLTVYSQVSADWWEGALLGKEGLIPDKYIHLRTKPRSSGSEDTHSVTSEENKRRSTESLPARTCAASPSEDVLDKAASHPNISVVGPAVSAFSSTGSDLSDYDSSQGSVQSLPSTDTSPVATDTISMTSVSKDAPAEGDGGRTTEDLASDIDSALAEVMSGLHSLELQQIADKEAPQVQAQPWREGSHGDAAKYTPDLVRDLPVGRHDPASPKGHGDSSDSSPTLSSAEMFAESNQSTIKKGTSLSMPRGMRAPYSVEEECVAVSTATAREGVSSFLPSRHVLLKSASPVPRPRERYSDPMSTTDHSLSSAHITKSRTLPATPSACSSTLAERPTTPECHPIPAERPPTPAEHPVTPADCPVTPVERRVLPHSTPLEPGVGNLSSRTTPERTGDKCRPPIKARPPIMRKPGRSPEVLQRLREAPGGSSPL